MTVDNLALEIRLIDDIKVDPELDVSLDKHGPKVRLLVRVADKTLQTANSRR